MSEKDFLRMMIDKAESSYCQPGEAVGLLCAQVSIAPMQVTFVETWWGGGGVLSQTGRQWGFCVLM